MQEKLNADVAVGATLCAANGLREHMPAPRFHYHIECRDKNGEIKWVEEFDNLVTTVGKNHILDTEFAGSAYTAAWYIGLVDNASFTAFAAADTMASHAGWIENTAYSQGARPTLSFSAASAGSKSASAATFTISGASGGTDDMKGAFVTTVSTKGGTTGTLYSCGAFAAVRTVNDADTLNVTLTVSG